MLFIVPYTSINFNDNYLKFTLYYLIIYKSTHIF